MPDAVPPAPAPAPAPEAAAPAPGYPPAPGHPQAPPAPGYPPQGYAPAPGYPQAPPAPGYAPQGYAPQGYPQAYPPVAPAAPSPAAAAPATWWTVLQAMAKGDVAAATDAATGVTTPAVGARWVGVFAALVNGLLVGFALMLLMARTASEMGYFFQPSGGDYVTALLLPVVCALLFHVARAGAIVAMFRARGRAVVFPVAAALAGIPFVVSAPFFALAMVLSLLPGTFSTILLGIAGVFTAFYAETSVYIAQARVGRFERSIALPHALASTAWFVVVSVVCWLVVDDVMSRTFGALGGLL